jgi:hypothetical protein
VPLLKWLQRLDPVFQLRFASGTRAVHAAENLSLRFDAVPDNPAVAVRTNRRQRVDRALEAIEGVTLPANDDLKRLVIFVLTNFAFSHTQSVRAGRRSRRYRRIVFYVSNTGSTVDEFQPIWRCPCARAPQSRCQLHRKRESQRHVNGCETSRSRLHPALVRTTGDQMEVHRRLDRRRDGLCAVELGIHAWRFVAVAWSTQLDARYPTRKARLPSQVCANLSRIMSAKSLRLASDDSITLRKSSQLIASNSTSVLARIEAFRRASVKSPISPK